jgi:dTDP-4-amino-4,6-dideoxygalactose transaminase
MPKTKFETIEAFLKEKMVEIRPFFYDIHTHSHLQHIRNQHDSTFAKHVTQIGVMLPSFPELTFEQQEYICNMIKEFWTINP